MLKINGRAAVVVPGQRAVRGRRGRDDPARPAAECDVHTLLRLPTGIFYAQGVKANVLFFDAQAGQRDAVDEEAVDLRPAHQQALHAEDEPAASAPISTSSSRCYHPENRDDRGRNVVRGEPGRSLAVVQYDELMARDKANLDIFWLRDESLDDAASLEDPDVIAAEIIEDLQAALDEISLIYADLAKAD